MAKIYHANLYGLEQEKCKFLSTDDISKTEWSLITPQKPFYLLIPQNNDLLSEYNQGYKITEIMPVNSVGIVTARDQLTIHWSEEEAWKTVTDFAYLPSEKAWVKYGLGNDTRDWKVELAQRDLKNYPYVETKECGPFQELLAPVLYRPFDVRYTYYTGKSKGFHCMPRGEVMQNFIRGKNLGLISCRQQSQQGEWSLCGATNIIIESCAISNKTKEINSLFPLYIYPEKNQLKELEEPVRPNLSQNFLNAITSKLGYTPTPEAIFYYIYAVFHSPTYRTRYAEFLKIDFPRVPLTSSDRLFRQLAAYGEELVALHLMKSPKLDNSITQFCDRGGDRVVDAGHPKYQQGDVIINKKGDRFTRVPENVWNFYVGGYQVCQKWLKDRKGRTLRDEDILHYQRIVVALQETIELMARIDTAIPSFPIQ
jgi:hypothetical protein